MNKDISILLISLNNQQGKDRRDSLDYPFTWIKGECYESAPDFIKENWKFRHNQAEKDSCGIYKKLSYNKKKGIMEGLPQNTKVKGLTGCLASHLKALEYIVKHKINNVIIAEDDAQIDRTRINIPQIKKKLKKSYDLHKFPQDGATLLGATLRKSPPWSQDVIFQQGQNKKDIKKFKEGINIIDYKKHRWTQTHAIFYPTWKVAKDILQKIKEVLCLERVSFRTNSIYK